MLAFPSLGPLRYAVVSIGNFEHLLSQDLIGQLRRQIAGFARPLPIVRSVQFGPWYGHDPCHDPPPREYGDIGARIFAVCLEPISYRQPN